MNSGHIRICAPARLHFGLLAFGNPEVRQFGGVGVMLKEPSISLLAARHHAFLAEGLLSDRVAEFARRWQRHYGVSLPNCRICVLAAPEQHVGLGVGTQLAMSVATALHAINGENPPDAQELSRSVGRGMRSCIGSYGFVRGGLLFELGQKPTESFAKLEERVELPAAWRVVQIRPRKEIGLSGPLETRAFQELPGVPTATTEALIAEVRTSMLPAAKGGDFDEFSESVFRYGVRAGECFAGQQGGPFASPQLESWVHSIRNRGVAGVGQSSWGPSLFAFQPDQHAAEEFLCWFRHDVAQQTDTCHTISEINNRGATVQVHHSA